MLEEYERVASVAKILRIFESEVRGEKINRNSLEGISRASLESILDWLQQEGDQRAFMDVYALLIYDIMLFSHIEDYVDLVAVDAFLAKRDRGENLVIVILANTYYSLNYCYEKNEKALRCCTTLLYPWLTAHLFHNTRKAACPIEDYRWSWIRTMTKAKWTKQLDDTSERSICWEDTIIRCGGFPNVPLIGTQGAINYNLELAPRQQATPWLYPHPTWPSLLSFYMTWEYKMGNTLRGSDKPGRALSEKALSGDLAPMEPPLATRPSSRTGTDKSA
ncbi:hypothetical protein CR513_51047, partial [Mucuna pruriens]